MKAWVIHKVVNISVNREPLKLIEVPDPEPEENEILIKVKACGICHTEIDEIEGRATPSILPVIPGHQIVGEVVKIGKNVKGFKVGDRAGAGWIFYSCGKCEFCLKGLENLCPEFKATGKDAHGGYAELFKIREDFAFHIPQGLSYEEIAPLFCAGAIGYRSLKLTNLEDGENLGLIGFGASNHLVLKIAKVLYPKSKVYVFSRTPRERELAIKLGASWAGDIGEEPPEKLNAAIDTTPVWSPPIRTLKHIKPSGRLVINAIRKEDVDKKALLEMDYPRDLWLEREIKSVANITRKDIEEFLSMVERATLKPEIEVYSFEEANKALRDIKERKIRGAKVLKINSDT
ncbi:MAG: zinc-dependent alcohol dehydrogenase family protein [Synergistetes bacterium]|nr:MAG: Alcohol dehydrogenase (NADP(+)) [bacterium 42_11]MBC7331640.1 zinc-dependent alcohol dehydrogenase family protein [Synergistota bacterium]MDK2870783.1 alcohol dehydrogenase, propanol-preferring [bacterium]